MASLSASPVAAATWDILLAEFLGPAAASAGDGFSSAWGRCFVRAACASQHSLRALSAARRRCLCVLAARRVTASLAWNVVLDELEWFLDSPLLPRVPAEWVSTVLRASATSRSAHNDLHFARRRLLLEVM